MMVLGDELSKSSLIPDSDCMGVSCGLVLNTSPAEDDLISSFNLSITSQGLEPVGFVGASAPMSLSIIQVPGDGSCMFNSLQVYEGSRCTRQSLSNHLSTVSFPSHIMDEQAELLGSETKWGDLATLELASNLTKKNIVVFCILRPSNKFLGEIIVGNHYKSSIFLAFWIDKLGEHLIGNHFDAIKEVETASWYESCRYESFGKDKLVVPERPSDLPLSCTIEGKSEDKNKEVIKVALDESYGSLLHGDTTFISNNEPVFQEPSIALPEMANKVNIEMIGNEVRWSFEVPDVINDKITLMSSSRVTLYKYCDKIRHELVAEAISLLGTDQRLDTVFKRLADNDDCLTPDFIFVDDNVIHVVELSTSRNSRREYMNMQYDIKKFKYELALQNRLDNDKFITLTPIVVSPSNVLSGVELPDLFVTELVLRMKISVALENQALEKGIALNITEERTELERTAQGILKRIEMAENVDLESNKERVFITDEFMGKVAMPTDISKVVRLYNESLEETLSDLREGFKEGTSTEEEKIDQYWRKVQEGSGRRDQKPLIGMPLFTSPSKPSSTKPVAKVIMSQEAPQELVDLWDCCIMQTRDCYQWTDESYGSLISEAMSSSPADACQHEEERHAKRSKYHRVSFKNVDTPNLRYYLAKDGINAKKYKDTPSLQAKREQQKRSFHPATSTKDIEEFLSNSSLFEDHDDLDDSEIMVNKLLEKAHDMAQNSRTSFAAMEDWMRTKWYKALNIITDIASELIISMKQNTSKYQMILKKLRYYDIYLLIKPTNSDSHIFYSIMTMSDDDDVLQDLPFRHMFKTNYGYVTDFCSVRMDKVSCYVNCSARFLTMVAFWTDFYLLDLRDKASCVAHEQFIHMMNLSMLISLENKPSTEECITITRYMYMEVFKSVHTAKPPNPFKMLPKFPTCFRSRLTLYLVKRVITSFSRMTHTIPTRVVIKAQDLDEEEDSLPGDSWKNLLNCFTGEAVQSASSIVNLMYLGYLKDKNESAQGNSEWHMIEKIVEEEKTLKINESSYGEMGKIPSKGGKSFSLDCIKAGCDLLEKKLSMDLGINWRTTITQEIGTALSRLLTHEIATLKASSLESHDTTNRTTSIKDKERVTRCKVIEALSCKLEKVGLKPMEHIMELMEDIERTSGGVICDLFKKNQHGGLREIYVLTIESRLVQLAVETISRVLCGHFEEETLTHPENKLKLLDQHKVKSNKFSHATGRTYIDLCSSSDKTRWNQNFLMTAMSVPLLRLLPKQFHNFIKRALNLWANKLIKIPPEVLKLLDNGVLLSSDTYQSLHYDYRSHSREAKLVKIPGSPFLNLTTGMMQGILHYTSSLLHLTFLHASKMLVLTSLRVYVNGPDFKERLREKVRAGGEASMNKPGGAEGLECSEEHSEDQQTSQCMLDEEKDIDLLSSIGDELEVNDIEELRKDEQRFFMTSVCSSDDSATILTMFCARSESVTRSDTRLMNYCDLLLHSLTIFCRCFCMAESVKSTISLYDYVEFNSEFIFKNTITIPIVKFVAATMNFTESQSFILRFHEMYNLLSGLFSSGFPAMNTYMVQVAQGILHYKSLGSSTGALFKDYYDRIITFPDCVHGFFLLDTELCPGLLGFSFSQWNAVTRTPTLQQSLKMIQKSEIESSPDGVAITSLNMKHGNLNRWYKLLDRIDRGEMLKDAPSLIMKNNSTLVPIREVVHDRMERINDNLHLFFRNPLNEKELKIKLLLIASMPGVSKSLSRGDPMIQAFSSSVYCMFTHCFVRTSLSKQLTTVEKTTEKISLLRSLDQQIAMAVASEGELDLHKFFPLAPRYIEAAEIIDSFKNAFERQTHHFRHRKGRVLISNSINKLPLTLLQCVKHLWYDCNISASKRVIDRCIDYYRAVYPWIRDTFRETIDEGPFESASEVYGFIASLSTKSRNFHRVGPSIHSTSFYGQLISLIKKSYKRCVILNRDVKYNHGPKSIEPRTTLTRLNLALQVPDLNHKRNQVVKVLLQTDSHDATGPAEMVMKQISKFIKLTGYHRYHQIERAKIRSDHLNQFLDEVRNSKTGLFIHFTKEQRRVIDKDDKVKWVGEGECAVQCGSIHMRVTMQEDKIKHIVTNNWVALRKDPGLLVDLFIKLLSSAMESRSSDTLPYHQQVGTFDGRRFKSPFEPGTKIYVDEGYRVPILYPENLKFRVYGTTCGIYYKSAMEREIPFLTFKSDMTRYTSVTNTNKYRNPWDAWTNQGRCLASEAYDLIEQICHMDDCKRETAFIKEWAAKSLSKRLTHKGIKLRSTYFEYSIDDSLNQSEMGDDELDALILAGITDPVESYIDSFLDSVTAPLVGTDEPELADSHLHNELGDVDEGFFTILNNWSEVAELARPITGPVVTDHYYLHPFWDDFIEVVERGGHDFFANLLTGVVPVSDRETARNVMKVLNIREVREQQTIRDLLLKNSEQSAVEYEEWDLEEDDDISQEYPNY